MRVLSVIVLFIITTLKSYGQNSSILKPALIVWYANGQKITLKAARDGISTKDTVQLWVYFSEPIFHNITKNKTFNFEIYTYYYMTTRKELINVKEINSTEFDRSEKNALILKIPITIIAPGWWEIQILNKLDDKYLEFANTNKFQIQIIKN